jgi:hypothetical protein
MKQAYVIIKYVIFQQIMTILAETPLCHRINRSLRITKRVGYSTTASVILSLKWEQWQGEWTEMS